MVLEGFGRVLEGLEGVGGVARGGEGLMLLGGVFFLYIFLGIAIDRSKKYIKVIKNYMKI